MKIYTQTGDEGFTRLYGNDRVKKSSPLIDCAGTIEELNALIGWCLAAAEPDRHENIRTALAPIQSELFCVGAMVATAGPGQQPSLPLDNSAVERMEAKIDEIAEKLPALKNFILPRGGDLACRLHMARTQCRYTERRAVATVEYESRIPLMVFKYLNRLSDLLFMLARLANQNEGIADTHWKP
jgi:cob(I)alamin adenosyltransferase